MFQRLASFGLVGAAGVLLNAGVYAGLVSAGVHYAIASVLGWALAVLFGFALNYRFTFNSNAKVSKSLPRVVGIYLAQLVVQLAAMGLLIDGLSLPKFTAWVITAAPIVAVSYVVLKRFGYR